MANFRGVLVGNTGRNITRLGHSSMVTEANTWKAGVNVVASRERGDDIIGKRGGKTPTYYNTFTIFLTKGSNGVHRYNMVTLTEQDVLKLIELSEERKAGRFKIRSSDIYLERYKQ
tara:strand:+ start:1820 stop:2167 length:348 start_codon:yes stop_codon:yes gene_type:complete